MKKIFIVPVFLAIALAVAPMGVAAQTNAPQTELSEAEKLALIAVQLQDIEREVNHLTLLVTKIALERQAADLQRQLAARMQFERPIAAALVAPQPIAKQEAPKAGPSQVDTTVNLPAGGQEGLVQQEGDDKKAAGFAAALGPLGDLGTPEIVALVILVLLAAFVLARRLSERGKRPLPKTAQPSQAPQTSPQAQPSLLQEGPLRSEASRQELAEKVAWK